VQTLVEAGIDAGVAIAPILPGLSSHPEQLEAVMQAARAAGATRVWAMVLHLRPGVREHFMSVLERHWPAERERYQRLYATGPYLRRADTEPVLAEVARLRQESGVEDRRRVKLVPPPATVQLDLAI
jgi:DNA repair photolyase